MENQNPLSSKKKIILFVSAVLVAIILLIVILLINKGNRNTTTIYQTPTSENNQSSEVSNENQTNSEAASNSQNTGTTTAPEKKITKNDVAPISSVAPQQINVQNANQVASSASKLNVSNTGFSPKEFSVKAGAPVTLSVTSVDGIHTLVFDDASLSAITLGINPLKTAVISFTAPTKTGNYSFRCNIPGHDTRGETGQMIVQ